MSVWDGLGGKSRGLDQFPDRHTSEEEISDLLHDAAIVCDMDAVVTDLSIPELLRQIVADIMSTIQVQNGLGLVHGGGNQDFVTHWVCLTVPISYSTHPPILGG